MKNASKRILLLLLMALFAMIPARADWIAAEHTRAGASPYYLMVNRRMNTLTVYTLGENGYYSQPYRAMICSTGREGHATPLGTFSLTGYKRQWTHMLDGSYGQYCSQFMGNYLIHSVCYERQDPGALLSEEYNLLGSAASLGCVRLQVADAKWVFDNCPAGTRVTVYDSDEPGALGKPERLVKRITEELDNGWEPTDPLEENPWHERLAHAVYLDRTGLLMETGDKDVLYLSEALDGVRLSDGVRWESADPSVTVVNEDGTVFAVGAGVTQITARCGAASASCTVTVTGDRLPFYDVAPGAWYYRDIRYACEQRLLSGVSPHYFKPDEPVSAAMMARALYNLTGAAQDGGLSGKWYEDALAWASDNGIAISSVGADEATTLCVTRAEFITALYSCAAMAEARANAFAADAPSAPEREAPREQEAERSDGDTASAIAWALENGLLYGASPQELMLDEVLTRAQLAVVLCRYARMGK